MASQEASALDVDRLELGLVWVLLCPEDGRRDYSAAPSSSVSKPMSPAKLADPLQDMRAWCLSFAQQDNLDPTVLVSGARIDVCGHSATLTDDAGNELGVLHGIRAVVARSADRPTLSSPLDDLFVSEPKDLPELIGKRALRHDPTVRCVVIAKELVTPSAGDANYPRDTANFNTGAHLGAGKAQERADALVKKMQLLFDRKLDVDAPEGAEPAAIPDFQATADVTAPPDKDATQSVKRSEPPVGDDTLQISYRDSTSKDDLPGDPAYAVLRDGISKRPLCGERKPRDFRGTVTAGWATQPRKDIPIQETGREENVWPWE